MRWTIIAALLGLTLASPPPGVVAPRPLPALPQFVLPPLWRLDLSTLGETPDNRLSPLESASASLHPLAFLSAERLAIAFLTHARPPQLTQRGEPSPVPLLLHLAVLDAATGRVLSQRTLPVDSASVDFVAAPGGGLVVVEPRNLVRLSPDLMPAAQRRLPPPAGFEGRNERVLAAPDGASFALSIAGPNWREDRWLRSADLATIAHRQGDRVRAVSDDAIVRELPVRARQLTGAQALALERSACNSPEPPPPLNAETAHLPVIELTAVCSPTGALLAAAPPHLDMSGLEAFLADHLMLVAEFPGVALYNTSFQLVRERRPKQDATAYGTPGVASAGGWFALPVWVASAGMSVLDMQGFAKLDRIAICDADGNRMFELKSEGKKVGHLDGLALSPGGAKLAVLYGGVLQVVAVPSPPARGWSPFDNRKR